MDHSNYGNGPPGPWGSAAPGMYSSQIPASNYAPQPYGQMSPGRASEHYASPSRGMEQFQLSPTRQTVFQQPFSPPLQKIQGQISPGGFLPPIEQYMSPSPHHRSPPSGAYLPPGTYISPHPADRLVENRTNFVSVISPNPGQPQTPLQSAFQRVGVADHLDFQQHSYRMNNPENQFTLTPPGAIPRVPFLTNTNANGNIGHHRELLPNQNQNLSAFSNYSLDESNKQESQYTHVIKAISSHGDISQQDQVNKKAENEPVKQATTEHMVAPPVSEQEKTLKPSLVSEGAQIHFNNSTSNEKEKKTEHQQSEGNKVEDNHVNSDVSNINISENIPRSESEPDSEKGKCTVNDESSKDEVTDDITNNTNEARDIAENGASRQMEESTSKSCDSTVETSQENVLNEKETSDLELEGDVSDDHESEVMDTGETGDCDASNLEGDGDEMDVDEDNVQLLSPVREDNEDEGKMNEDDKCDEEHRQPDVSDVQGENDVDKNSTAPEEGKDTENMSQLGDDKMETNEAGIEKRDQSEESIQSLDITTEKETATNELDRNKDSDEKDSDHAVLAENADKDNVLLSNGDEKIDEDRDDDRNEDVDADTDDLNQQGSLEIDLPEDTPKQSTSQISAPDLPDGLVIKSEPLDDSYESSTLDTALYKIKVEPEDLAGIHDDFEIKDGAGKSRKKTPRKHIRKPSPGPKSSKITLPFEKGWHREVVIRNYDEGGITKDGRKSSTLADTYYYTPCKRKLRSLVKVAEFLDDHPDCGLTVDHFSFVRKPIYHPPEETVRAAGKSKVGAGRPKKDFSFMSPDDKDSMSDSTPIKTSGKRGRPRRKDADISPDLDTSPTLKKPKRFMGPASKRPFMGPASRRPGAKASVEMDILPKPSDVVVSSGTVAAGTMSPPSGSQISKGKYKNHLVLHGTNNLCSLNCPGMDGQAPSLQCGICMCLFHPQCVNFVGNTRPAIFVCLRCKSSVKDGTVGIKIKEVKGISSPNTLLEMKPSTWTKSALATFSSSAVKDQIFVNQQGNITTQAEEPNMALKISNVVSQSEKKESSQGTHANIRAILSSTPAAVSAPPPPPLQKAPVLLTSTSPAGIPRIVVTKAPPPLIVQAPGRDSNVGKVVSVMESSKPYVQPQIKVLPAQSSSQTLQSVILPFPSTGPQPVSTMAAPMTQVKSSFVTPVLTTPQIVPKVNVNQKGQLLTLPAAVVKRLNMNQPLAIKLNNQTHLISPSCFIPTNEGIKILLPPNTILSQSQSNNPVNMTLKTPSSHQSANNIQTIISQAVQMQQQPFTGKPLATGDAPGPPDPSGIKSIIASAQKVISNSANHMTLPHTVERTNSTNSENADLTPEKSSKEGAVKQSPRLRRINPYLCHIKKLNVGYDCLSQIFSYLNTADLLRASCVCKTWNNIIMQSSYWKTTRLRDSRVSDWEGLSKHFQKYHTDRLDMRGMLHFDDRNRTWHQLTAVLGQLTTLRWIDFGQAPAMILHAMAEKLKDLEVVTAEWISDSVTEPQLWTTNTKLDIGKFTSLVNLRELKLRGLCGLVMPSFSFSGGLTEFASLKYLKSLSLTTLKDIPDQEFSFVGSLINLEKLELGDCSSWSIETYRLLGNLINLETLRLEHGNDQADEALGESLKKLTQLKSLDLVMFAIGLNLSQAISQMLQLNSLSLWPNMEKQAAQVNTNALEAVMKLSTLKHLDWAIMPNNDNSVILNEDSGAEQSKMSDSTNKSNIECIPFICVQSNQNDKDTEKTTENENEENLTEFISINQLMDKLCTHLPKTKIRVYRVPVYSAARAAENALKES